MNMKNYKLWTVWVLFLICTPAMAQLGEERGELSVGINGGINMSKVDFNPRIKQKNQNGMSMGVTFRYMSEKYFKTMWGIPGEINFSQRGWNELIEDGTENTYNRQMNYLEIPLLAHLAFGKDSRTKGVKFFVNLGPQFSYFINDKENKGGGEWDDSHRPNRVNYQYGKEVENKLDYGIVAGGGLELSTPIGHFQLEGRYYYGLGDFYKNSKKDDFGRSGHSYIGIRMTYLYDIIR